MRRVAQGFALSCLALAACACGSSDNWPESNKASVPGPGGGGGPVPAADESDTVDPSGFAVGSVDGTALGPSNSPAYEKPVVDCSANAGGATVQVSVADPNGMASAARARQVLENGEAPQPDSVVPRDFLNYYSVRQQSQLSAITTIAESGPRLLAGPDGTPVFAGQFDALIGLEAPTTTRGPLGLVVMVDNTPSLGQSGLAAAGNVLHALANALHQGDHVSVFTAYSPTPVLDLDVTGSADSDQLVAVADSLTLGDGEIRMPQLLDVAYQNAEALDAMLARRILIVSDGEGDPNEVDTARVEADAAPGSSPILLTTLNTGSDFGFHTRLLRTLSAAGRGAYVYVNDANEATRLLGTRFDELTGIAADSVTIQLSVPAGFAVYGDLAEVNASGAPSARPTLLPADGSLVFLLRLISCAISDPAQSAFVSVQFSYQVPGDAAPTETQAKLLLDATSTVPHPLLDKALLVDQYAHAIRTSDLIRLNAARTALHAAVDTGNADPDVVEMQGALDLHPAFDTSN